LLIIIIYVRVVCFLLLLLRIVPVIDSHGECGGRGGCTTTPKI
jgi:hypothetical protein